MAIQEFIFGKVIPDQCDARSKSNGVVECRVTAEGDDGAHRQDRVVYQMSPVDAITYAQQIIAAAVAEIQGTK